MSTTATFRWDPKESEAVILGGCLADPENITLVVDTLGPDPRVWNSTAHRLIWRHLHQAFERGNPLDAVGLIDALSLSGHQRDAGGVGYVSALIQAGGWMIGEVTRHVGRLAEHNQRRSLHDLGRRLLTESQDTSLTIEEVAARAEAHLSTAAPSTAEAWQSAQSVALDAMSAITDRAHAHRSGRPPGVRTGLADLDHILGGLRPGWLCVLAGRPGMGKSSLGATIAANAARQGKRIGIISLEMTGPEFGERLICSLGDVSTSNTHAGTVSDAEIEKLQAGAALLAELPIHWQETSRTLGAVRSEATRLHGRHGLDLLMIDYLTLITAPGHGDRRHQVGAISRGLKLLAQELRVPVLLLAQLNRACDDRRDKRPRPSDLKESGDIEQDADLILLPFRPSEYDETADQAVADIHVAKFRHGRTGRVPVRWAGERMTFQDEDRKW